jgi:putative sigma-54 modulation protein
VKSTIHARQLELDEPLKARIERKLTRLDRIASPDAEATVELTAGASRVAAQAHQAVVTVSSLGITVRSEATGTTPIAAIDAVIDKIERQLVRARQRQRAPRRDTAAGGGGPMRAPGGAGESAVGSASGPRPSRRVVEIDRMDMVPMFPEDAIDRMEELDQAFFVFLHAQSGRVNVAYRLSDGGYGVIDPVLKGKPAVSRGR